MFALPGTWSIDEPGGKASFNFSSDGTIIINIKIEMVESGGG